MKFQHRRSLFLCSAASELMKDLAEEGFQAVERFPGIYYLESSQGKLLFPAQIVVTERLSRDMHSSLRVLTRDADEEDVRLFLTEAQQETAQGERENVDAILQVSVSANQTLYEKIRRDQAMCQALRELMKDEIAQDIVRSWQQGLAKGRAEGRAEGQAKGKAEKARDVALQMIRADRFSAEEIAHFSGLSLDEVQQMIVG